jgi:hypothetical protein
VKARRSSGKISVMGVVMVAVAIAGVYFGAMYLPVLSHRMSIGDVAREAAAKTMVEHNDTAIREWVFTEVKNRTGIQVGTSEIQVSRGTGGVRTVTVKWTEQVQHVWGTRHVLKMQVTEAVEPSKLHMKNAE